MGSRSAAATWNSDFTSASSKDFFDIKLTIECGFTLKFERDMIKTHIQIDCTDKYPQHSSIIWPVWLNRCVFVYELSGCGFESSRSHLKLKFLVNFEQGVPWYSGKYRVWIHSETRTWHDQNTHSKPSYRWIPTTQLNHLVSLAKWLPALENSFFSVLI